MRDKKDISKEMLIELRNFMRATEALHLLAIELMDTCGLLKDHSESQSCADQ